MYRNCDIVENLIKSSSKFFYQNKEISKSEFTNLYKDKIGFNRYVLGFVDNNFYIFDTVEEAEENGFHQRTSPRKDDRFANLLFNTSDKYSKQKSFFCEFEIEKGMLIGKDINFGKKSPSFITTHGLRNTFGVEIETNSGTMPPHVYYSKNLSLLCVRDGSLRNEEGVEVGGEYVTGVLTGDAGLLNLKKSLIEISKRCTIDKKCGIHVHVGGCNFSKQFNVLAYILALKIEDEVFNTLPPSRRDNETCGRLFQEDYLNIIRNYNLGHGVEICFKDLFNKISNGRDLNREVNRKFAHPGGRYTDRYSRNINPSQLYRYKWINFVPSIFNMKGNEKNPVYTLEFRSHPASLNFDKISKWIKFCLAFVYYVENNFMDIIKKDQITINDILEAAYGNKSEYLKEYFENRKERFKETNSSILEIREYKETTSKKIGNLKQFVKDTCA